MLGGDDALEPPSAFAGVSAVSPSGTATMPPNPENTTASERVSGSST
jgi:hypothetical protein